MTVALHLLNIAGMRSITLTAIAAVAAATTVLVAGCGIAGRLTGMPATTTPVPATTGTGPATGTSRAAATPAARQIPVTVESDSQMEAAGNDGPSSSILLPTSCQLAGTTITAEGGYTNGGLVPDVYDRYGDIIMLYVFAAPSAGYPEGIQLGTSAASESPVLGSEARWHVSLSISPSVGVPAECVVAAQPTHDEQLAP